MRYQGKIVTWKDERGFGFVKSNGTEDQAFLHISAFQEKTERPVVGDSITYEVESDASGRKRAVDAAIVKRSEFVLSRSPSKEGQAKSRLVPLLLLLLVASMLLFGWAGKRFTYLPVSGGLTGERADGVAAAVQESRPEIFSRPSNPEFVCDGRIYCSQMNSCAEATFFLQNCPGTRMDGGSNGRPDGVPCERQWCN